MTATTRRVQITLPLPPTKVGPNGREHWAHRARELKALRWESLQLTREAIEATGCHWWAWQPMQAARLDVEWRFTFGPQPDQDNAWARLKAQIDGVSEAGLVVNDRHVTLAGITFERVPKGSGCVVLTISEEDIA